MNFFGKKTTKTDADTRKNIAVNTGNKIDEIVQALIDSAADGDAKVRPVLQEALQDVGKKQPVLVLSLSLENLVKNSKLSHEHRIILWTVIFNVLKDHLQVVEEELASVMVSAAMQDMTKDKDVIPDLQGISSQVLVSLGARFPGQIQDELMKRFESGQVPHYFVMKTLGDLAVANAIEIVPRLREVLARITPVLGSLKHDNMRWVFAATLGHFSESILAYTAHFQKEAMNRGLPVGAIDTFAAELFPAYEFMFNNWLGSREPKVRLATVQAIGNLTAVLTKEQFEAQLARLLPAVLGMYRKERDQLPITQGVCMLFAVGIKGESRCLEPHLNLILGTLHPMVCQPIDETDPASMRNNNELLRCFEVLGRTYSNAILAFLLARLESRDAGMRSGTLKTLKHVVTRLDGEMADKKGLLVSGIKPLLNVERDLEVKKSLLQLIIAMAGYDYLPLEGGEYLVAFVVQNCSLSAAEAAAFEAARKKLPADATSPSEIRGMSENSLFLMTTTVPSMVRVLWPYLLEHLPVEANTDGVAVLCRCLAHLAAEKRAADADDYMIDFDRAVNLPKPHAIIARLLVLLNEPARRQQLGHRILELLRAMGPVLHPAVADMWDTALPKMAAYLDANLEGASGNPWNPAAWEDLCLRLLAETVKLAADDEWACALADHYCKQLDLYRTSHNLRKCALKHIGLLMQKIGHKERVRVTLQAVFDAADHSDDLERLGTAIAFGYAAATHLDLTLEKIQELLKGGPPGAAKGAGGGGGGGGGFFSSLLGGGGGGADGKKKGDPVHARATLMLCYGYVTAYANIGLITSRVEIHVANQMKPYMLEAKSLLLREAIIKAVDLIGKAMHPSHLKKAHVLTPRDDMLRVLLNYVVPGSIKDAPLPLLVQGLGAISTLLRLAPPVQGELEQLLLEKLTTLYASVTPEAYKSATTTTSSSSSSSSTTTTTTTTTTTAAGDDEPATVAAVFDALNETLSSVLFMDSTVFTLARLLKALEPIVTKAASADQRERALQTVVFLLKRLVEYKSQEATAAAGPVAKSDRKYTALGAALAVYLPRCTDPSAAVRGLALDAVNLVLFIDHVLKQSFDKPEGTYVLVPPDELHSLTAVRERIAAPEINEQFALLGEVVQALAKLVADDELGDLLQQLLAGLLDAQPTSANGTCVLLNGLLKLRGKELAARVPKLVAGFLQVLPQIAVDQTANGTLFSLRSLAHHHLLPVVNELVAAPVPHSPHVVKCLQVLAKDAALVLPMCNHLLDHLNNGHILDERPAAAPGADATTTSSTAAAAATTSTSTTSASPALSAAAKMSKTHQPKALSVTCALGEVLQTAELEAVVREHFAKFFGTLLLRLGTAVGGGNGEPGTQAIATFTQFAKCAKEEQLEKALATTGEASAKRLASEDEWVLGVSELARVLCRVHGAHMAAVYRFLQPFLRGNYSGQRIATAVVMAEMVNHAGADPQLLQALINSLLTTLADAVLKRYGLRGLGNVAACGEDSLNTYAATVLDALMSSIDDGDEGIAMEAMRGLAKVFELVGDSRVAPVLVNICIRIRPAFEKTNDDIRAAAFTLFGTLSRFGVGVTQAAFVEQVHTYLPALVLHANDEAAAVTQACRTSLRKVARLLDAPDLRAIFDSRGFDAGSTALNYDEFLNLLSKHLIAYFPDRTAYYVMTSLDYLRSPWNLLRANAALFVGFMLGNLPVDKRPALVSLNPPLIANALIGCLKEKDPRVRLKAGFALSLLWSY